jgi:hypothetical protein
MVLSIPKLPTKDPWAQRGSMPIAFKTWETFEAWEEQVEPLVVAIPQKLRWMLRASPSTNFTQKPTWPGRRWDSNYPIVFLN